MFSKILVAVDGSDISKIAFHRALDLAKQFNAELHTVSIVESGAMSPGTYDSNKEMLSQHTEKTCRDYLTQLVEEAKQNDVMITTHIDVGHAGNAIIDMSSSLKCDLIVMGSRGKGVIDRLILGSVSSHVVNNAKISVLVIKN